MTTHSPDSSAKRVEATSQSPEDAKAESQPIHDEDAVSPTTLDGVAAQSAPVSETAEVADDAVEPPIPAHRAYGYWLLLLFVVFVGSLASLAWYGWNLFQANAERINHVLITQKADQNALGQALQASRSQLDQLSKTMNSAQQQATQQREQLQTESQSTQQKLAQRIDNLDHHYAQIEDRLGRGELAWQVAEIGFLLTRAEERLSVAHDPAGAEVALTLADQRLARLSRPEVLPVRSAISQVLARLQTVDAFDRVGMALTLRRSASDVSNWPLAGTVDTAQAASAPVVPASSVAPVVAPWYVRWPHAVWQPVADWLGRQFTVTHSDEPLKASARASTDRETLIWLTAVREALLARDTPALEASIRQAEDWIKPHYDDQASVVSRTLKALEETGSFYAAQTLPNLAPVFKAWRASGLMAETTTAPPAPAVTETHP
ncbi:uroporphyrinogen-III C-methyltransferase [Halothiobacillus sp.]|uniref:uroporphyrinogen-III C-methyltransferase n=1 Tax=Halothiobacillus sp. TaxID=1891311 RepID=UPI002AD4D08E|nr:uroporphyrinogen-III C-methyltransferase [Halothiobacillus sp.]